MATKTTVKKPITKKETVKPAAKKKEIKIEEVKIAEIKVENRGGARVKELSMLKQLKEITSEAKGYLILWKYAGYRSDLTFEELCERYIPTVNIETIEKYEFEPTFQEGVKLVLKLMHSKKMADLYNTYYQKAIDGDVNSAKFFVDFSKQFLEQDSEGELSKLIKGIDLDNGDIDE